MLKPIRSLLFAPIFVSPFNTSFKPKRNLRKKILIQKIKFIDTAQKVHFFNLNFFQQLRGSQGPQKHRHRLTKGDQELPKLKIKQELTIMNDKKSNESATCNPLQRVHDKHASDKIFGSFKANTYIHTCMYIIYTILYYINKSKIRKNKSKIRTKQLIHDKNRNQKLLRLYRQKLAQRPGKRRRIHPVCKKNIYDQIHHILK